MNKIILATNNKNKVNEITKLLSPFNIEVNSLKDLGLGDPVENGLTFLENATIKAKYAFDKTGLPSLADDSGFCVESLNNFPGLASSRFIKSVGGENNAFDVINKCINEVNKNCFFITSLVFIYKDKNGRVITKDFEGKIEGKFTYPPRGNDGFGFDPIFTPNGYNQTFAEMLDTKIEISHRTRALKKFFEYFKTIQN